MAASTSVYHEEGEETEAALELSECIAESLMDHFTERGLLAKEIKVREMIISDGSKDVMLRYDVVRLRRWWR